MYREKVAVCSEVRTLCGQNMKCFTIKPDGTNSNHWDWNS